MIKVTVNNVIASASELNILTAGMVKGRSVVFNFSPEWEHLSKTAVFTNGLETRTVPEYKWIDGRTTDIPPEVLTTPNYFVKCGVYGVDEYGERVIPTLWAELGRVFPSASPGEYQESVPPTPNTWDDLQNQIGVLSRLLTEDKNSLVNAVNEVLSSATQGKISITDVLPEPSEEHRGKFLIIFTNDTDKLYICMKIAGEYKWTEFGSSTTPDTSDEYTAELGKAVLGQLKLL